MNTEKEILTIDEASELTGYSKNSIYAFVSRSEIPYFKARGTRLLRFERKKLIDWLKCDNSN